LSIISACISALLFALGVFGAAVAAQLNCQNYDGCSDIVKIAYAMNALMACMGVMECFAAIWGAVVCSKVWCCCRNSNGNLVTLPSTHQIIIIPQQQMMSVPFQLQSYPGQAFAAYQPGYPPQQMVNNSPPPYLTNSETINSRCNDSYSLNEE